jgi:hypothetical protein
MSKKGFDILYELLTNQLFILAVAFVLFLLFITLMDPSQGEAVIWEVWI